MKNHLLTLSVTFAALSAIFLTSCEKEDKDAIPMDDVKKGIQLIQGKDSKDYEVVDLGLTSGNLWATCNIGATSPEQTGNFYSWGETATKESYEWSTYKWSSDGDKFSITKYCLHQENGQVDNKKILEAADDVANVLLGTNWHMPDVSDYYELIRSCNKKWCKLEGVGGFLFTSKKKGFEDRSLFLPLAGAIGYNKTMHEGKYGWYWSTELFTDDANQTKTLDISVLELEHVDVDNQVINFRTRYLGLPVRPVYYPD